MSMTDDRLEELNKDLDAALWDQNADRLARVLGALGNEGASKAQLKRFAERAMNREVEYE